MRKTFSTTVNGRKVELPGTIHSIREVLPPGMVEQFIGEIEHAGADEIPGVLARWALRTPQAQDLAEEEQIARIRAGDLSGLHFDDSGDDSYRSRG
ncbi:hypothetical protein [Streptomyces sp. NPDC001985]|uniref:hypothetical protein n=1 Tax=Streptomyces sp. NPDC001985 TaxID=3154406 RepID=UPI0033278228